MSMNEVVKKLSQAIDKQADKAKTTAYDTPATVRRIEGDTAWVHIPGGVDETPVKLTISAKEGDQVQVRVSGGSAFMVGNGTNPPTDDARANEAYTVATVAEGAAQNALGNAARAKEAADSAQASASAAESAAGDAVIAAGDAQTAAGNAQTAADSALVNLSTVQDVVGVLNWITAHGTMTLTSDVTVNPAHVYFVVDPAGDYVVGGTHYSIVSEPKDAELSTYYELTVDESVQNYVATHIVVDSEGLWIVPDSGGNKVLIAVGGAGHTYETAGTYIVGKVNNVDTVLAQFTADGAQIGQPSESHLEMDYHSLQLIARGETTPFFWVSDLRDKNDNYQATITETFTADGGQNTFSVQLSVSAEVSATDSSHSSNTATRSGQDYTFATTPSEGATVTIVYKTGSILAKAYTLGQRASGVVGVMSVAEGYGTTASGMYSHAEGDGTAASGKYSHAEGFATTASGMYSHAEGYGTIASDDDAHAEGTHTAASGRYSHAEGYHTTANGTGSHAEGSSTTASVPYSHSEGFQTVARGWYSHAQNQGTIAGSDSQTAIGRYNDNQSDNAFEIGNGTSDNARSNALTVDWSGNVVAAGGATLGGDMSVTGDVTATGDVTDGAGTSMADLSVDYIVENGTSGIWKYHKFSDRTYHAWYEGATAYGTGSSWCGGYFHKASGTTPPSFSTSVKAETGFTTEANLAMFCGVNLSTLETYWLNGSSASSSNFKVRLDLYGTW